MKKFNTKALVQAAVLLAICIVSQFFKNMSVYITGPIINTCLIICVLTAGLGWAVVLSIVTPITSYLITGSPIMSAIPVIIPAVMLGNIIMAAAIGFVRKKTSKNFSLLISMAAGSILKALFMGTVIALFLIPAFLPEKMLPKMTVFQTTFSVTQLITALIGSALAYIIWLPLKKVLKAQKVD